jgi:phospholipase A1/A2
MRTLQFLSLRSIALTSLVVLWVANRSAVAQHADTVLTGPRDEIATAGGTCPIWLHYLNPSAAPVTCCFPPTLAGSLFLDGRSHRVTLELRSTADAGEVVIPAGSFARREYRLQIPLDLRGQVVLATDQAGANRVLLTLQGDALAGGLEASRNPDSAPHTAAAPDSPLSPATEFFRKHFSGYEPFYFVAGEAPTAKFQLSFKYRMLNADGSLATKAPWLTGLQLAYTQTSLWELSKPSAPFFDTSYKPELLYALERVDRGKWADWFRLDLQTGFQHESNGRGSPASRSLNLYYFRPTARFGAERGFQLTLTPRAWTYVGDMSDNPDLPDYRGYVDLRTILGWSEGLQLASSFRLGDDANRGSATLDLSYPLYRVLGRNLSVYAYAQYFTGYGESLLLYDERSSAIRAGFALYR